MHKLASNLTEYLIVNEITGEELREEYIYGFEVFGLKCINYVSIFILAWILEIFIPTLFFACCFFTLRGRTGGYHANSAIKCYIGTIGIFLFTAKILTPMFENNLSIMLIALIFSSIIILWYAPINHENLDLSKEELKNCKVSSKLVLGLLISGTVFAISIDINSRYIAFAISGVVLDAGLLCIQKLAKGGSYNKKQY